LQSLLATVTSGTTSLMAAELLQLRRRRGDLALLGGGLLGRARRG
jgi:hypothetical protein